MKGDWKCVALGHYGAPYATDSGLRLTPELCVIILATVMKKVVHYSYLFCYLITPISFEDGGWLGCLQGKAQFQSSNGSSAMADLSVLLLLEGECMAFSASGSEQTWKKHV